MEDLDLLVNGMAVRIIFRDQILSWFQEKPEKTLLLWTPSVWPSASEIKQE